jgi:hypothetical protein
MAPPVAKCVSVPETLAFPPRFRFARKRRQSVAGTADVPRRME